MTPQSRFRVCHSPWLRNIFPDLQKAADAPKTRLQTKYGNFFASCMNSGASKAQSKTLPNSAKPSAAPRPTHGCPKTAAAASGSDSAGGSLRQPGTPVQSARCRVLYEIHLKFERHLCFFVVSPSRSLFSGDRRPRLWHCNCSRFLQTNRGCERHRN